eukprot:TRINITY_DN715_c0_g1_i4.p1 TRINITY_DN715_c0_g1~~TRINITY_DN715_c0_g1_i4.p1  ORF type:complete len:156 (+),score=47.38 TRINITY_DN715_c0_g1_i4:213-680(+)
METPEAPDNTCSMLTQCCSRYAVMDSESPSLLEISCQIDYAEACCDEADADVTCCDLMSPPDCTTSGCGTNEVCDEATKICIPEPELPADCMGVPGGDATIDDCGICGGDGSTCDEDECTPRSFDDSVAYCERIGKKKKYRLRGRSSETAKAHRG